jgi:hypothetical protein
MGSRSRRQIRPRRGPGSCFLAMRSKRTGHAAKTRQRMVDVFADGKDQLHRSRNGGHGKLYRPHQLPRNGERRAAAQSGQVALGQEHVVTFRSAPLGCFTGLDDLCRLKLMSFKPQGARCGNRIDTSLLPPSDFITTTMDLAVMSPTERDRKLIADFATKCP